MSVQQLPYEILESIFRILQLFRWRENQLTNCAMVCKAWYLPACRVIFEKLQVGDISTVLENLKNQNSDLGVYCKVLHLDKISRGYKRSSEEYEQLLSYLPNIQTIILEGSYIRIHHLNQFAQHAELAKHVKAILLEGEWRPEESQSYYHCAIAFKDTLQHMTLDSLGETITSVDGRFGNMIDFLSDFTALTTLRLVNQSSNTPNLPQLSMFRYCAYAQI